MLVAENTYPSRDSVIAANRGARFRAPPIAESDSLVWWWSQSHGIMIPYAITTDAVQYYLARVERYREGHSRSQVRFRYIANVERADVLEHGDHAYANVHVVRMHLYWWHSCGELCGLSFGRERTVVVAESGEVLFVDGDGDTSFRVF
jgi:hypothetical protein